MTQNCNCHGSGGQNSQTVAATLERPRYSPGLILEDSDLDLGRRLYAGAEPPPVPQPVRLRRDLRADREDRHDCGLNVTVSPGLALDGCGDPLQLPAPVTIAFDKRKADQISMAGKRLLGDALRQGEIVPAARLGLRRRRL